MYAANILVTLAVELMQEALMHTWNTIVCMVCHSLNGMSLFSSWRVSFYPSYYSQTRLTYGHGRFQFHMACFCQRIPYMLLS